MLAKPTAINPKRTPYMIAALAFFCAMGIAWSLHGIQSTNTQIPDVILWPSLFLLSYIPALFIPMFISDKPQKLIQAFIF